jgi:hypothetical protein
MTKPEIPDFLREHQVLSSIRYFAMSVHRHSLSTRICLAINRLPFGFACGFSTCFMDIAELVITECYHRITMERKLRFYSPAN